MSIRAVFENTDVNALFPNTVAYVNAGNREKIKKKTRSGPIFYGDVLP